MILIYLNGFRTSVPASELCFTRFSLEPWYRMWSRIVNLATLDLFGAPSQAFTASFPSSSTHVSLNFQWICMEFL